MFKRKKMETTVTVVVSTPPPDPELEQLLAHIRELLRKANEKADSFIERAAGGR
jgi:hypothetical protein